MPLILGSTLIFHYVALSMFCVNAYAMGRKLYLSFDKICENSSSLKKTGSPLVWINTLWVGVGGISQRGGSGGRFKSRRQNHLRKIVCTSFLGFS